MKKNTHAHPLYGNKPMTYAEFKRASIAREINQINKELGDLPFKLQHQHYTQLQIPYNEYFETDKQIDGTFRNKKA